MPFLNKFTIRKMICLGLSATLIYNTTVPAFGQEFSFREMPAFAPVEMVQDGTALRGEISRPISEEINEAYHAPKTLVEERNAQADSVYARALAIKYAILGNAKEEEARNARELLLGKQEETNDVKTTYINNITGKYNSLKAEALAKHNENLGQLATEVAEALEQNSESETYIREIEAREIQRENEEYNNTLAQLEASYQEALAYAEIIEAEYNAEVANNPDAFFNYVKPLVAEIIALYDAQPQEEKKKIREHLLELTSIMVSLINEAGEHLYTLEQAEVLRNLYIDVIHEENANASISTPWVRSQINTHILKVHNPEDAYGINMCKRSTCANYATDCPDTCLDCLMYREEIEEERESIREWDSYWENRWGPGHD